MQQTLVKFVPAFPLGVNTAARNLDSEFHIPSPLPFRLLGVVFVCLLCYTEKQKGGVYMYKINRSVAISEDLKRDLVVTDGAVVDVQTDYHGDIHVIEQSRLILRGDLYGTVNVSGNSVVEYYATIHNGLMAFGDSGTQYARPMSASAHVIGCSNETHAKNIAIHRQLESGELNPPLYPSCKTE